MEKGEKCERAILWITCAFSMRIMYFYSDVNSDVKQIKLNIYF